MGADEEASGVSPIPSSLLSDGVKFALEHGWTLTETESGQLLLVPPPTYGEPPAAA